MTKVDNFKEAFLEKIGTQMQDVSDFQKEIEDDMKWQIKESKNNEKIIKD